MFVPQLASCLDPVARSDAYKHLPLGSSSFVGPCDCTYIEIVPQELSMGAVKRSDCELKSGLMCKLTAKSGVRSPIRVTQSAVCVLRYARSRPLTYKT